MEISVQLHVPTIVPIKMLGWSRVTTQMIFQPFLQPSKVTFTELPVHTEVACNYLLNTAALSARDPSGNVTGRGEAS
jgi:hypothetical protein